MVDRNDSRQELRNNLQQMMEWRREQATKHPDDGRHKVAALILGHLLRSVCVVPERVITDFGVVLADDGPFADMSPYCILDDELREIGVQTAPYEARDFVVSYLVKVGMYRPPQRRKSRAQTLATSGEAA